MIKRAIIMKACRKMIINNSLDLVILEMKIKGGQMPPLLVMKNMKLKKMLTLNKRADFHI